MTVADDLNLDTAGGAAYIGCHISVELDDVQANGQAGGEQLGSSGYPLPETSMETTMRHTVIYRREGWYTAFPQLDVLEDGRLAIGVNSSPFHDHFLIGEWKVLVSDDEGTTWQESDDPTIPYNWDASGVRERYDRYTEVLAHGTWLSAGSSGWQVWPTEKLGEIEGMGLMIQEHQTDPGKFVSGWNRLFFQRSNDGGKSWDRREYTVPGVFHIMAFPRPIKLVDGAILIPVASDTENGGQRTFLWRSDDGGGTFRLVPMGINPCTQEMSLLEYSPGRLLALVRAEPEPGYLLEMWSDDAGLSWTWPVEAQIWAPHSPPHLLKLRDGRVLCSYGYREDPMGVRAVISRDNGRSWDIDNTYVLRDDGGYDSEAGRRPESAPKGRRPTSDVGYAQSTQLPDGDILTVYYITPEDGVTHAAATRWQP
jgi:hypothetical protein